MRHEVAALVALAALAAGCGEQGEDRGVAASPVVGETMDAPAWPSEGCEERVHQSSIFVEGAKGAPTPRKALAPYVPEDGRLVQEPRQQHRERRWLAVDADNRIIAAVALFNGGNGWLVSSVEECAG
jgi:hypothetical protein